MEKQIITFSANEQKLIKTGGIECYASNIVSYIEAHFDLGANWSGYDSVRAVWSNDNNMSVISTVLDADGVCVVPFEVLKTKGKVMVNLVGSISVSDVLTDRLTTFPCEAVKVTAKAKIEGSETQPITPSQFEQFVAAVISEVEKVTGMTAQAETLPAGSQATARYENGILYLGIPQGIQGERGETGADGNGIASVVYNADYTLTLVFDDGERFTTPPIRGERGPAGADGRDGTNGRDGADGVTPNLSIGTVETLEPTQDAYVTRRGTDDNPIFDFGIPKGDTGEVTMSQLSSLLPTDTASGSIASFPDGTDILPAISVLDSIEPIQDLHGYDKPWSGGNGKNKVDCADISAPSTSNTTYSVGLGGASYVISFDIVNAVRENLSNTSFLNIVSSGANNYFTGETILKVSDNSTLNSAGANINGRYYCTVSNMAIDSLVFLWRSNSYATLSSGAVKNIMVEVGTTPSAYEPYTNICPISGHTEVVTSRVGKNWSPTASWSGHSGTAVTLEKVIPANTPITVSGLFTRDGSATNNCAIYFKFSDNTSSGWYNIAVNSGQRKSQTVTLAKDIIGVSYYSSNRGWDDSQNYTLTVTDFQIELGTTATAYEPYNGTQYTTALGRTVYGGTLDVVSGVLTVDRASVDLSTLTWSGSSGIKLSTDIANVVKAPSANNIPANIVAEKYATSAVAPISANDGKIGIEATGTRGRIQCGSSETPSGMLCYELATPQTYQLDPTEVDLLLGQNNLWTDCGAVEVTYKADIQGYIDKKLSTSGTRSLSMGLTKSATVEAEAEETKTETEETKTETEPSKTETETETEQR